MKSAYFFPTIFLVTFALVSTQALRAQNLISNPSFEADPIGTAIGTAIDTTGQNANNLVDSSLITDWRFFDVASSNVAVGIAVVAGGSNGSQAVQLDVNNIGGFAVGNYGLDKYGFLPAANPATAYTFSFDVSNTQPGAAPLSVTLAEYDSTGTFLGQQTEFDYIIPGNGTTTGGVRSPFVTYTEDWTPLSPSVAAVNITFGLESGVVGAGEVILDNVNLSTVAVPEPSSTVLMLGSCVLLLMAVRRRLEVQSS